MSALGQKRGAEDRIDRDGKPEGAAETSATTTTTTAAAAGEVVFQKRGPRPEDAPSNNPFKGLPTPTVAATSSTATAAATAAVPTVGFGAFASNAPATGGFGAFGAFAANKPTAAEASASSAAPKFSFSFGAAAANTTPAATTTTAPAPVAAPTFSFSFGAPAATTTANTTTTTTTAAAPPVTGGFSFGAGTKFDFTAGVKAFAAAQTAEKKSAAAAEGEAEEDPEKEEPIVAAPHKPNALSAAPKREAEATGDESDTTLYEVPNTKVYMMGFLEVAGPDGKMVPSTTKEWKEKGVGTLKVNSFELDGATHHRLLMHSTATKQVVLNVTVDKWFAVTGTTEKTVGFRTVIAGDDGKPKPAVYNLRVVETAVQSLSDKLKEITPKKE